jgi:hypothetical protein
MTMLERPEQPVRYADSLARFVADAHLLASGLRAVVLAAVALTVTLGGYQTGYRARRRDWSMPDDWHRDYLRGKLQGMKDRHGPTTHSASA